MKKFKSNGGEVFGTKNNTDVISNNDSNSSGGGDQYEISTNSNR